MNGFRRLSIFHKMLIAPGIVLGAFAVYLLFTYAQHQAAHTNLTSVRDQRFPLLEIAGRNITLLENIAKGFKDAVSAGELSWLEETAPFRDEIQANLETIARLQGSSLELEEYFRRYYDSGQELSRALILGDQSSARLEELIGAMNRHYTLVRDGFRDFRSAQLAAFTGTLRETGEHMNQILVAGAVAGILSFLFLVAATLAIALPTRRSLLAVLGSMQKISQGEPDFSTRVQKQSDDELGRLVECFNTFTAKLETDYRALAATLEELRTTQGKLVEAEKMAALGNLVAGVAHEINTPIGTAYTTATVLNTLVEKMGRSEEPDPALVKKTVEKTRKGFPLILTNLQRASELIKSFKRVSVDQHTDQLAAINLSDYIRDVVNSLHYEYAKKGKHTVLLPDPDPRTVTTYPGTIGQIVTNMVMNSVKHGFKGREGGLITIGLEYAGDQVVLRFADDGSGIPREIRSKVFDPFFTTDKQDGTGLGMHIVYNLVTHKLGGTILLEETDRGAAFTLTLPLTPPEPKEHHEQ